MCAIRKPILCESSACGKRHEGIFYQCTTCISFTIHSECAFLPKTLLIQQRTNGAFYHTHPLTISYSFPWLDQIAKHLPRCRICGGSFDSRGYLWTYKCDKCMYYAHLDCATRVPPAGAGQTIKDYKDEDIPHLLHLPFPDETYSLPKHLFFKETGSGMPITSNDDEVSLQHISHQHPLIFVQTQSNGQTSSSLLLMCHDPLKKTQLQCNGCLRPIMATHMPFYRCAQGCDFALHEWCTRLPQEIENHPGHPQHTLLLIYSPTTYPSSHLLRPSSHSFGVFNCDVCLLPCNGFAYGCVECGYYVDVSCGFIPKQITHEVHPNHLLTISVFHKHSPYIPCPVCNRIHTEGMPVLHCNTCPFFIHPACALLLPKAIRNKYDKHPMYLSYLPIENHKSDQYFSKICEEDLNSHAPFYHCKDCAFSVHAACYPLILRWETHTHGMFYKSIYYYVNIKFGGILNTSIHPHPLLFTQGILSDGKCSRCGYLMLWAMIFKCLECKFAIHSTCWYLSGVPTKYEGFGSSSIYLKPQ